MTREENRGIAKEARNKVKEAKAQLELSPPRDNKDSRKSCYRHVANKRKPRDNAGPLQKEKRDLTALNREKGEAPSEFCICLQQEVLQPHNPS